MLGSLWRYSHFALALVSGIFLILASITGAVLALEPINESLNGPSPVAINTITLSQTVDVLKKQYEEVLELEITPEKRVKGTLIDESGDLVTIFVDPETGLKTGDVRKQSPFFSFVTNLHRSLFLKGTGRAFVGIVSLLLCVIAVTGVFLLAQRQGGFRRWFSRVRESDFAQRYHVTLGRWLLIPIVLIAATGVYLSAEKFSLLPTSEINHSLPDSDDSAETELQQENLFKGIYLNQVRTLVFPFSEAPEDYFELALTDREQYVHQYTGVVLSEVPYPFVKLASQWSMEWHTGRGSVLWSIVLLIASLSLLFFMYSGFSMSIKRLGRSKKNVQQWASHEAAYILLVGSETGNTFAFARAFSKALKRAGKSVFVAPLNTYDTYDNASHIIVFTATYGDGDAPSNARKFAQLFQQKTPKNNVRFAVVGFGSQLYPHFCRFAVVVDGLLHGHKQFEPLLPLEKIDDQSNEAFLHWVQNWNRITGMQLDVRAPGERRKKHKTRKFTVIERTALNVDNTAIIRLRPKGKIHFESGDLLNVTPPDGTQPRSYSIANIDGDIVLSVKWHPHGVCSTFLCTLKVGAKLEAAIIDNPHFHYPKNAPSVWMVANGTGIAPYLGMVQVSKQEQARLTWGGRTRASFDYYEDLIEQAVNKTHLTEYQLALSQEDQQHYVQNLLMEQGDAIAETLDKGGVFMLCGSLSMQDEVLHLLDEIATERLQKPLSHFENNKQVLTDCY